ncbi:MAG: hypothetical protein WED11_06960, partial [Natronospirillum sp.]
RYHRCQLMSELSMTFKIRPAHASDTPLLYQICLTTGTKGQDATPLMGDPYILGHCYLGAYLALQPDCAFVLTDNGTPCGYIVGAPDTASFSDQVERRWLPGLREQYAKDEPHTARSDFEQDLRRLIHARPLAPAVSQEYPAHLHINLLPVAQGAGGGRALLQRLFAQLGALEAPGIHLIQSASNQAAFQFYLRVGFEEWSRDEGSITLVQSLP